MTHGEDYHQIPFIVIEEPKSSIRKTDHPHQIIDRMNAVDAAKQDGTSLLQTKGVGGFREITVMHLA